MRTRHLIAVLLLLTCLRAGGVAAQMSRPGPLPTSPVAGPSQLEIAVTPASGSPGSVVTVSGAGLKSYLKVRFVYPGGTPGLPVETHFVDSSHLTFVVPSHATCGPFDVSVAGVKRVGGLVRAITSNTTEFTVAGNCQSTPTVKELDPATAAPRTVVTVTGTGFRPDAKVRLTPWHRPASDRILGTTFLSPSRLRFTVPYDARCGSYVLKAAVPDILKLSNPMEFGIPCPRKADWQIRFDRLYVLDEADDAGDEPYLVAIGFRSRFLVTASTQVWWSGVLDDHWAAGIHAGEARPIPEEMGVLDFPEVSLVDEPAPGLEILGSIVIPIDHDGVPFSVIRAAVEAAAHSLEQELWRLVERGEAITLDAPEEPALNPAAIDDAIRAVKASIEPTTMQKFAIVLSSLGTAVDKDDIFEPHVFLFLAGSLGLEKTLSLADRPEVTTGVLSNRTFKERFEYFYDGEVDATYFIDGGVRVLPRKLEHTLPSLVSSGS